MNRVLKTGKKNREINNLIFYIALSLWYFIGILNETVLVETSLGIGVVLTLRWVIRILLIIKILRQTYYRKDFFRVILFGTIMLFSFYMSNYQELIWLLLFVIAAQNIEMRPVVKVTLITTLVTVLAVIALAAIGFIYNEVVYSINIYNGTYSIVRLYGFSHHNFLGCRIFLIYMCYVFLYYDNFKWMDYGIGIACSTILYAIFRSRTSAVLLALSVLIIFMLKVLEKLEKKQGKAMVKFFIYSMMLFSLVFSIVVTIGYQMGNPFCIAINTLIYKRFSYASSILSEYGLSLFGQKIALVSSIDAIDLGINAVILDNAYMLMLIRCGLVFFLLVMLSSFYVVNKSINEKNYKIAVVIVLYFICGISEKWLFTVSYNPFVLLSSMLLFNKNCYMAMEERGRFPVRHFRFRIIKE